jgi:DNA-binding LytR/AlgR family response regulator
VINCLIVEDEPLAAEILQDYVRQIPFLELKSTCTDAIFALEVMNRERIDLIFLDIHLPGLKGLDFLKSLQNPPAVILTTAYHEYALEGYELNVVDYLLKPIEFQRFVAAVNKVQKLSHSAGIKDTLVIHSPQKCPVSTDEVQYISQRYIKIHTLNDSYTSSMQSARSKLSWTFQISAHTRSLFRLIRLKPLMITVDYVKPFLSAVIITRLYPCD